MKKLYTLGAIVVVAWFSILSAASASELLCAFSTTASSTGCVTLTQENFVAFAPSASSAAGTYSTVQSVALTADGATSIRYTADGTASSCTSGTLYSAPLSIKKTQTIKAIACYPQNTESAVVSFAYLLSIFDASTENAALTNASVGAASLPTRATSVRLSDTTVLDVSSSINTASGGQITIAGATKTLVSFTSGSLSAVNLSIPITVGGQSVSVGKAVAIQSGVSGEPVLLSNQGYSPVSISIPDGAAVLAPSGWDGTLAPPRQAARAGEPPLGFSVAGTIVEVGSPDSVLLFDKPVSVVLSNLTGAVGYKSSGSTVWMQIANQCGGSYDAPTAPVFPGECVISDGIDTKVYTYHLTSFAMLDDGKPRGTTGTGSNGPVGSGGLTMAGDMNGDGAVDIFDFNILFAVWGGGSGSSADLNSDGAIDILDFNQLMLNWK